MVIDDAREEQLKDGKYCSPCRGINCSVSTYFMVSHMKVIIIIIIIIIIESIVPSRNIGCL